MEKIYTSLKKYAGAILVTVVAVVLFSTNSVFANDIIIVEQAHLINASLRNNPFDQAEVKFKRIIHRMPSNSSQESTSTDIYDKLDSKEEGYASDKPGAASTNKSVDHQLLKSIKRLELIFPIIIILLSVFVISTKMLLKRKESLQSLNVGNMVVSMDQVELKLETNEENTKKQQFQGVSDKSGIKYELIYQEMIKIIDEKKLYLDPDVSQHSVLRYLGTNKKYLYMSIKLNSDTNFRGVINNLRIIEAKRLIEERVSKEVFYSLSDIYNQCGFPTNESFYRCFKTVTNMTPGKYAADCSKGLKYTTSKIQSEDDDLISVIKPIA